MKKTKQYRLKKAFAGSSLLLLVSPIIEPKMLFTEVLAETTNSAAAVITDPSILSLADKSSGVFYTDAASPANVRPVDLNVEEAQAGDVVTVDLNVFTLNQIPIVNGATVKLSGSILIVTFTQDVNGAVSIPLGLTANFTNAQKSLSTIQTAVNSGKTPGLKTITATKTKKSDGTSYESSLDIDAELSPYSAPTGVSVFRTFSGSFVQNRDYTFNNGFNTSVSATDGLAHPGLSSWNITPVVITDIPGDFVLTGGTGWTQSGTTLTYDGTGNGQFTGHFKGTAGTYTVPAGILNATSYYGYDTTPVVISNIAASNFQIIAPTPQKAPTLGVVDKKDEIIYQIDPSQLFGRTIPENVEEASFTATFFTNDPTLVTPGDNNIASAQWEIVNQKAPNLTYIESFTVPAEAANGAVVTFNDGTTKTYPAGTAVNFEDPESNYVTKIVMNFDALPSNTAISMPFKYYFADTSATKVNQGLNEILTGTYTNYGGTFNPGGTHAYGPSLYVYTGLTSGTALYSDGARLNQQNLLYGDGVGTYQLDTTGVTSGNLLGNSQIYEPVSYVVLPLGVDYQGATGGLSGYKVSTYTISTGQTVVKINYTGSGQLVGASASDWPMINYQPKAYGLPHASTVWSYISAENDPAMTLRPDDGGTKQPADSSLAAEITQGNTEAIFSSSMNVSIDGTKYLTGSSSITNNVGVTGQNAVNDLVNGTGHSLVLDLLNSTATDEGNFMTLTNLPEGNDGLTLNLTGPGLLRNSVTGEPVTDSKIGQILYSTSRQSLASGQLIDKSDYLTADQVTDWSKIQSFIVEIEAMNSESEYTAELPLTAPDAIHQLNKPVSIVSNAQANGLNTVMTSTDEFTSSAVVVHGTVHYEANSGNSASLPADQNTEDFLAISPEDHSVTLSNTQPTKDKDAYYSYDFSGWNTKDDGTGRAYQPGDTINKISGGETVTLYAQWRKTSIPPVTAKLHYDANSGDTSSLPSDETISFQPSQTGETTVSSILPTKAEDDRATYIFKGWNTKADGSGSAYQAGDPLKDLTAGSTTILYAQWKETLKTSTVTTHFVDSDGNTIAADVITTGTIDSIYQTQGLSGDALINGDITYNLTETPANATGVYTPDGITVTYVYSMSKSSVDEPLVASTVTVHYVDTDGNAIAPDVVTTGEVGHAYTTHELTGDALINGDITYRLTETPANATGVYTSDGITVTYVYSMSKSSVDEPLAASTVTVH
ncbi:MucBP domain-containing protein, partial [Lactovum odontotermitis]